MPKSLQAEVIELRGVVNTMNATLGSHIEEDKRQFSEGRERFDRMFKYLGDNFQKIDARFDNAADDRTQQFESMENKLSTLWDDKNQQAGAIGLGKWAVGGIGAVFMLVIGAYISKWLA